MKNNKSYILVVFCCTLLLLTPSAHITAQQLAPAANTIMVDNKPNQTLNTGSTSFINNHHYKVGNTQYNTTKTNASVLPSASIKHHKYHTHSYGAYSATSGTANIISSRTNNSSNGSTLGFYSLTLHRRITTTEDEFDDDTKGSKNPPYNPPDMPDADAQTTWQKTYNGAPLGSPILPLLLLALATLLFKIRHNTTNSK